MRLSYANIMSTIAVFIALGGTSYAAVQIHGKNIKKGTVGAKQIGTSSIEWRHMANNAIRSLQIRNKSVNRSDLDLASIARAAKLATNAASIPAGSTGSVTASCPTGTKMLITWGFQGMLPGFDNEGLMLTSAVPSLNGRTIKLGLWNRDSIAHYGTAWVWCI